MKINQIVVLVACLIPLVILFWWAAFPLQAPDWTGFGSYTINQTIGREKKLWDWLDLLLVPLFLAFGAWYLSRAEKKSDREREKERFEHDTFSKYLEFMTQLILKEKIKVPGKDEERAVARTQTLRVTQLVSRDKKGQILQFLYESELISRSPVVNLNGAEFSDSNMERITLVNAELRGIFFTNSNLRCSHLSGANFAGSNFAGSVLNKATLKGTDFTYGNFSNAIIRDTDLTQAILTEADFTGADLTGSTVTNQQVSESLLNKAKKPPTVK